MASVTYTHPDYSYKYRLDENLHNLYTLVKAEENGGVDVDITSLPIDVENLEQFRNRLITGGWIAT